MINLTKEDKITIKRILDSIQGRLNENLINLIRNLIFKTKIKTNREDFQLYSANIEEIPDESIPAFSVGSYFGQTFQISLDLAKKMNLKLDVNQKRILREFVFFLVLLKFGKETNKK